MEHLLTHYRAHLKVSTKPGLDYIAVLQVPDFVGKISISWIAIANVCFHLKRTFRWLKRELVERLLSAKSGRRVGCGEDLVP